MDRNMNKRYEAALAFATRKHAGQKRIGGDDYITHPVAVAEMVRAWGYPDSYQIAALFHDLLEDTDATEEQIAQIGGVLVLGAVKRLTKTPGYNMRDYVRGIKKSRIARVIKAADRLHNLRCAVVAGEAFRKRYVEETTQWYLDLCPEMRDAVQQLKQTIE